MNINKTYKENDGVVATFEEDMQLTFTLAHEKEVISTTNEELGQVFTSPFIANFMVELLVKKGKRPTSILDPCIGPNTFPKHIARVIPNANITAVEIDNRLCTYDIELFYNRENRRLIQGSFFDFPISEKYSR